MADRRRSESEPEVFERLQRLAIHERRRRWDSTRNALAAGEDEPEPSAMPIPPDLVDERFDRLEGQVAALARELRRNERRSKALAVRVRTAILIGLLAAIGCVSLWLSALRAWVSVLTG